jgi:hypothetical protein
MNLSRKSQKDGACLASPLDRRKERNVVSLNPGRCERGFRSLL